MIDLIFLAVQNFLQTAVPAFLEIEWFLHQYDENDAGAPQIQSPALYIEFAGQTFEDIGCGAQQALATVNFHVMQEDLHAEGRITDTAMDHYGLVKQLFAAMHGKGFQMSDVPGLPTPMNLPDGSGTIDTSSFNLTGSWTRTVQTDDHSYTNLLHTILQFQVAYRDWSAEPVYEWLSGVALNLSKDE